MLKKVNIIKTARMSQYLQKLYASKASDCITYPVEKIMLLESAEMIETCSGHGECTGKANLVSEK